MDGSMKKMQKRKWGLTLQMDRPRRGQDDGRTVLQKAMDLKAAKSTGKGMTQKASFAFESNEVLLHKAHSINISFGNNDTGVQEKIDKLKQKRAEG